MRNLSTAFMVSVVLLVTLGSLISCGVPKDLRWNATLPAKQLFYIGQELYERNYKTESLKVFQTVIDQYPSDLYHSSWSQYEIGNIYYDLKKWNKALDSFNVVIEYEQIAINQNKIDDVRQPVRLAKLLKKKIESHEQYKNSSYSEETIQQLD